MNDNSAKLQIAAVDDEAGPIRLQVEHMLKRYGSRVVGTYVDAAGVTHGFVTTAPEPGGVVSFLFVAAATLRRVRPRLRSYRR